MQFLVIGRDDTDDKSLERRMTVRQAYIDLGKKLMQSGNMWYDSALLDDKNQMIGSMLIMDFPSNKELQEWLDIEPYIIGKVWESVEIQKCNVREPWKFNRPQKFFESQ